jgi:hypothetical protein
LLASLSLEVNDGDGFVPNAADIEVDNLLDSTTGVVQKEQQRPISAASGRQCVHSCHELGVTTAGTRPARRHVEHRHIPPALIV